MKCRPRTILYSLAFMAWTCMILPNVNAETFELELKRMQEFAPRTISTNEDEFIFRTLRTTRVTYRSDEPSKSEGVESDFSSLVKKEPEYKCDMPFKGVIRLGSEDFLIAFDSTGLQSNGFDLLYFDRNQNGDLTDDELIQAKQRDNQGRRVAFPRVDLILKVEGKEVDYSFMAATYASTQSRGGSGSIGYAYGEFYSCAYRIGEVILDGKKHRIAILDYNSNGRFDDEYAIRTDIRTAGGDIIPKTGDMILLDPDTQNRMYLDYFNAAGRREKHYLSQSIFIDGNLYDVKVTPSGDKLTLTPSKASLGSITNPNPKYAAVVYGDKGFLKVKGTQNEKVALPEGKWRLFEYVIDASEQKANQNRRSATYVTARGTTDCPEVVISKGESVNFPFGPPYKPSVSVSGMRPGNTNRSHPVRLSMGLIGSAGETCTDLAVNGGRPPDPSFVIATPSNEIIERGKFEYG